MAIIRFGALVGGASGTIGGTNVYNSKAGPAIRQALRRTKPQTQAQLARRARWAQLQIAWAGLTPGQRRSWNRWATTRRWRNRLGITREISGFASFMQHNWYDSLADGTSRSLAPALPKLAPPAFDDFTIQLSVGYTFVFQMEVEPLNAFVIVKGQPTVSARPRSFFNALKVFTSFHETNGAISIGLDSEWIAAFGAPQVGEVVAASLTFWNAEAEQSDEVTRSTVVSA